MKMLKSLILALLMVVTFGCAHVNPAISRSTSIDSLQPGNTFLSYTKIRHMQNATARFEAYDSKTHLLKWTGTAWCFYQGQSHSLWMTCRHVAKDSGDDAKIIYRNAEGFFAAAVVTNVHVSEASENEDMAVFMSDARPASTLMFASGELEVQLKHYYQTPEDIKTKVPILMASSGHMGGAFPSVVTVGAFVAYDSLGVRSTVGGWYGVSGSALVDLNTMTVVGMQYRFADAIMTNRMAAVPIGAIKDFINTVDGLED